MSLKISCYFVGYSGKSWGFKFYDPSTRGIFETGNAHFFEDIEFDGGNKVRDTEFQEEHDDIVNLEGNLNSFMCSSRCFVSFSFL